MSEDFEKLARFYMWAYFVMHVFFGATIVTMLGKIARRGEKP